jgi:hypothetical protein
MRRTVVTCVGAGLLLAIVSGCGDDADLGVPSSPPADAGKAIAIDPKDMLKKKTEGMANSKSKPATP